MPNNLLATTFPPIFFFQLLCIMMSGSSIYRNIDQAITKGDGTQKDFLL